MAKFIIECPVCGRYTEASTSLFAKKKIKCVCGYNILIKTDKVSSKKCENCGNTVIYDQSLGEKAVCPVCKHKINTVEDISNHVNLTCPTCGCKVNTNKNEKAQKDFITAHEYELVDPINILEKIEKLDQEIEANATNSLKLNELMGEKGKAEAALEEKMDRWVYLTELAERIEAGKNK